MESGSYFASQLKNGQLDPFACLGLPADNPSLTLADALAFVKKYTIPHVFERNISSGTTVGPQVPTWAQVNIAKDTIAVYDTPVRFRGLREEWVHKSRQTWNPQAVPGSAEALIPRLASTSFSVEPPQEAPFDQTAVSYVYSGIGSQEESVVIGDNTQTRSYSKQRYCCRKELIGVYLGASKSNNLDCAQSKEVYCSRKKKDQFKCRISKGNQHGGTIVGSEYVSLKTVCSHGDVDYSPASQGLKTEEANVAIATLLVAQELTLPEKETDFEIISANSSAEYYVVKGYYIVQEILESRFFGHELKYLIKWEGYQETTWEPAGRFMEDQPIMVAAFHTANPLLPAPSL